MSDFEPVDVVMPQMGESITEGTIVRWHRSPGDFIEEGDTLLEITTQKVEVEIPSPATGTVGEILYDEDATVPIDTVIAIIHEGAMEGAGSVPDNKEEKKSARKKEEVERPAPEPLAVAKAPVPEPKSDPEPESEPEQAPEPLQTLPRFTNGRKRSHEEVEEEREKLIKRRSSPLVRKMALEHGIDLELIQGSGLKGRVTARDLENYLRENEERHAPPVTDGPSAPRPLLESTYSSDTPQIVPMSPLRRAIADNLLRSIRTIPHAYTVHEIDFTRLEKLRGRVKMQMAEKFEVRVTPLVFLIKACAEALLQVPAVNASWRFNHIESARTANIGIAIAVKDGLLVPVLKGVERLSLPDIAAGITELADKAKRGKLKPSDFQGGTFSISSPGSLGALFATPIINQQQGAILHFGAIQKVPAVITDEEGNDAIAIRKHAMLTLGIDHRLVDGWEADTFMGAVRAQIERCDFDLPDGVMASG